MFLAWGCELGIVDFRRLGVYKIMKFVVHRDAYGFALRPQHTQRYKEYAKIYKVSAIEVYFC